MPATTQELDLWSNTWIRRAEPWRSQDLKVFNEVVRDDCYAIDRLPDFPPELPVIDVGAHIGCFAMRWRWRGVHNIYCVEANPDNIPALWKNVGAFACINTAACTYELRELRLANSIFAGGTATGGSSVHAVGEPPRTFGHPTFPDPRPVRPITLEQLHDGPIGLLKLDCEGSEHSILRHAQIDRIQMIVGEWHDSWEWLELLAERFKGWNYVEISRHVRQDCGVFHLYNPRFGA